MAGRRTLIVRGRSQTEMAVSSDCQRHGAHSETVRLSDVIIEVK